MSKLFQNVQQMLDSKEWNEARKTANQNLTFDQWQDCFDYANNSIEPEDSHKSKVADLVMIINEVTQQ